MNIRIFGLSVAVLCLTAGGAIAQTAAPLNCQSITQNGKLQLVCDSAADNRNATRSSAREEVTYTLPPKTADARPAADPNFCGRGFRYTADGCQPAKP